MHRYESEFNTMEMVEQRLMNARSELTAAERRLGGRGQVTEEIRAVVEGIDDTLVLTRRAKRIILHEWQKAERAAAAA